MDNPRREVLILSDNLVELNKFRLVRDQNDSLDDEEWKKNTVEMLEKTIERVKSGETTALTLLEIGDEIGKYRVNMYGFSDYDIFTAAGIMENFKLTILGGLYDE